MELKQKFVMLVLGVFFTAAQAQEVSTAWYDDNPGAVTFEIHTAADLRGLSQIVNDLIPDRFINKTILLKNDIDLGGVDFIPIGRNSTTNAFMGCFDGGGHTISGLSVRMIFPSGNYYGYAGLFGYVTRTAAGNTSELAQIKNVNVIASTITLSGGNSSGDNQAGVLAGYYNSRRPIINCNVKADSVIIRDMLASTSYVGGLVGFMQGYESDTVHIRNSSAIVHVVSSTSSAHAGGLVGRMNSVSGPVNIDSSYVAGSVTVTRTTGNAGGLIGHTGGITNTSSSLVTITNSYAVGEIFANCFTTHSGGLIGHTNAPTRIIGSYSNMNIYSTVITGSSSSNIYSGGLVGRAQGPVTVTHSYAIGNVSAYKNVASSGSYYSGGLIGFTNNSNITVNNSYASGEVTAVSNSPGNPYAGGIFGRYSYLEGSSTTAALHYNSFAASGAAGEVCSGNSCGNTNVPGTFGQSIENLKRAATFTGWDFNDTWAVIEGQTTPFLRGINSANNVDYSLPVRTYTYNSSEIVPEPTVWTKNNGGAILNKGTHYTLSYEENINVGRGTVTITGINAYAGLHRVITFDITPKELTVSGASVATKIYDGTTDAVIIGAVLQGAYAGDDVFLTNLTGTFADANAGVGITVTPDISIDGAAADNYYLTLPAFAGTIERKPLAQDAILPIALQIYNGGLELTPAIIVKDGGIVLVRDADYMVSYANNTEIGALAAATAEGIGNYTGTAVANFEIATTHLPFTESFENGPNGWVFVNGTAVNRWIIGSNTSNTGSYSAYISNNNDTLGYTITNAASTVHLYRDIVFPVSDLDFSMTFHARANGERIHDYMVVRYCDTSVTPTTSQLLGNNNSTRLDSLQGIANWTRRIHTLPAATFSGKAVRFVFTWRNDGSFGTQPPAAIDDIEITIHRGTVSAPTLAGKTRSSITINTVDRPETEQVVEYARSNTPTAPTAASAWQTSLTFSGLIPNTDYYIFARARSDADNPTGPPSTPLSVRTDMDSVPLTEGFEDGTNGWILVNGNQTNKWRIGAAASNTGSRSAYISNNDNANQYTQNAPSVVHMYKDIAFPTSNTAFTMSFSFRGRGNGTDVTWYDFMEVRYTTNMSVTPQAGQELNTGTVLGRYLNISDWTQQTVTFPASLVSDRPVRLIFTWRNTGHGGIQPPAAIDDITINFSGSVMDAQAPNIIVQPQSDVVSVGAPVNLSVIANTNDGGTLAYRWYRNTVSSVAGATQITGSAGGSANYSPSTAEIGTMYYFVEITNTIIDNGDGGNKRATVTSGIAAVTVSPTSSTASSEDRTAPEAADVEAAVIVPVTITAGEFTAGPNPVPRSSGEIAFYWQGRQIEDGVLTVYDAAGNAVNRVRITDNADRPRPPVIAGSRRVVGTWDLRDNRGRPVADGTYLVRGAITVNGGSKERVSIMIGVR
ncbi:MAG: YDG domain-containing protein [Chitinispirillales bacterium]|jgi:hypothetical protein|nr:YDG domain-containing protein [Chitinispirillales bacterium]